MSWSVGREPQWQGEERESLCGSQTGLESSMQSDRQTGILRNLKKKCEAVGLSLALFNCPLQISSLLSPCSACGRWAHFGSAGVWLWNGASALPHCRWFQWREKRRKVPFFVDSKTPFLYDKESPQLWFSPCTEAPNSVQTYIKNIHCALALNATKWVLKMRQRVREQKS